MAVVLEDYRYDIDHCVGCRGCYWLDLTYVPGIDFATKCPAATKYQFDAYMAYGKGMIARDLMDGKLQYTPKILDIIYQCNQCGACDAGCKLNLDLEILLMLEGVRAKCVKDGAGPMPELKKMAENLAKTGNTYGTDHSKRLDWVPKQAKVVDKAEIVYYPDDATSFGHPEIGSATARILAALGVAFMVPPAENWSSGQRLYEAGMHDEAMGIAERNVDWMRKSGAKTILLNYPDSYQAWKVTYPKLLDINTADLGFEVLHLSEYLDPLIKDGELELTNRIDMDVTYHDPCNLARKGEPWVVWHGKRVQYGDLEPPKEFRRGTYGVYQPPRDVLTSIPGIQLVEMPRMRENAWCCGAGGGVLQQYPDFAIWTAGERLREALSVGAEALVVACPDCKESFARAARAQGANIKIVDLAELVAQAMAA